ncbi:hypothetical protein [Methylomonas sp. AM2-LC]|jgi:hypothetical protein|uniref:hypothetical protein n=1 Tax=Methylomonas sp. AM2-LC TaxID=3153301 RepID=UPI0032657A73
MKTNFWLSNSEAVEEGKLRGATDYSEFFYFFCPKCEGDKILRLLDYRLTENSEKNRYDGEKIGQQNIKSKCAKGFTLQFQCYCENCGHADTFKISNLGWQGGNHSDSL